MADCTPLQAQTEAFQSQFQQQCREVCQQMLDWAMAEPRSLADLEQQTLQTLKTVGATLLTRLCALLRPAYPPVQVPCAWCGQAQYQRTRAAQVLTLLGAIQIERAYYLCASCHHGHAPLDQQLEICAGSISRQLAGVLALLGAHGPFAEAANLLEQTTLVTVCPNTIKAVTETLGQALEAHEQQTVDAAWQPQPVLPAPPTEQPERLYLSLDGVLVHTHEDGWKELKLGSAYTTTTSPGTTAEEVVIRAQEQSYVANMAAPAAFGKHLWVEAVRRGVLQARAVVVIGDGAHWIWNLAAEHVPQAVQIVDWYHASQYIWNVAKAVYGEGTPLATAWAKARLSELWDGQIETVLAAFRAHAARGAVVQAAISYYTNNQARMQYPHYRAKGYQIGSGTIERGCTHVIAARLKQAGMIWTSAGVRRMATVRTWLKSGRWSAALTHLPRPQRSYQRAPA